MLLNKCCDLLLTPSISSNLYVFLHGSIFADDCAKELLKPSKDSACLYVCNEKKFGFGFLFFCE